MRRQKAKVGAKSKKAKKKFCILKKKTVFQCMETKTKMKKKKKN